MHERAMHEQATQQRVGPAAEAPAWRWDDTTQAEWDALLALAAKPTLEQSWAYGAAVERISAYRARRAVAFAGDRPVALLQMFERAIGPLRLAKVLRGPILLEAIGRDDLAALLATIARAHRIRHLRPLFWLPELPAGAASDTTMRALGKRPMVRGHATVRVDLAPDEAALRAGLDRKWRNKLGIAERAGLRVQLAHGGRTLDMLVERHEAFRRGRRHRGPSGAEVAALVGALARKEDVLVLTALAGNQPVAALLIVAHGRGATYHIAWTGDEGRKAHAHNLLLWRGMLALKQRGTAFLDLGGVEAGMPGVARFKLGLGGRLIELAGTFL